MNIGAFTTEDVDKEIKRRRLDPAKVMGLACTGCGIFSGYPFAGPWGHFSDCLRSSQTRYLSFQLRDGTYNHPGQRDMRKAPKRSAEPRQGPIILSHTDY